MLTLGNLYKTYNKPEFEAPIHEHVLGSLKLQWAAADQDVFILVALFHPWICTHNAALTQMQLMAIMDCTFKRIFETDPGFLLVSQLTDYCNKTGIYSDEKMMLTGWKNKFEEAVCALLMP
jgi:hypothetical protein